MTKVSAFGVAVFDANQRSKNPPKIVQEVNLKLAQLGINADDVITIQVEQDFYHVFYREKVDQ